MFSSVSLRTTVALTVVAVLGVHTQVQAQFPRLKTFKQVNPSISQSSVSPGGTPKLRSFTRPGTQNPTGGFESASNDPAPIQGFSRPGVQNPSGSGFGGDFEPRSGNRPGTFNPGNGGFEQAAQQPSFAPPSRPGVQNDGFASFDNFGTFNGNGPGAFNPTPKGLPENPLPTLTHQPILILCGQEQVEGIQCTLRGGAFEQTYHLRPGEQLRFKESRPWTIEFHRGGSFGEGRYRLIAGLYTFRGTEQGWELFRARQK